MIDGNGHFESAIESAFVGDQQFMIMVGERRSKSIRIGFVHGSRSQEEAFIVANGGNIGFADQFAVGDIKEILTIQKIDEIHPLLDVSAYIGLVAAIGLLEKGKSAVSADRHGPDQLFEVFAMLLAVAEGDFNAVFGAFRLGFAIVGG